MTYGRIAAFAGLTAALLMIVAGLLGNVGGSPPGVGEPAPQIASYYQASEDAIVLSALANAFVAIPLLLLAEGLQTTLSNGGREESWLRVGIVGAGIFVAMLIVVSAIQLALPVTAGDPATAVGLSSLWHAAVVLLGVAMGPLLVGFGVAVIQSERRFRWIGWVALAGAVAGLIGSLAAALDGPLAGFASLVGGIQYPAFFVWVVASSLLLWRSAASPMGQK